MKYTKFEKFLLVYMLFAVIILLIKNLWGV